MKIGDYVEDTLSGYRGTLEEIEGSYGYVDIECSENDGLYEKIPLADLKVVAPLELDETLLKNIFRMNINLLNYAFDQENSPLNVHCSKPYLPSVDDLLSMVMNLKIKNVTIRDFYFYLLDININLKGFYLKQTENSKDEYEKCLFAKRGDLFDYVFEFLDISDMNDEQMSMMDCFDIDGLIMSISTFKRNEGKELLDRNYDVNTMERFILTIQDNDQIDKIEYPYTDLFKRFTENLASKENPTGLEVLGYCYYGGNKLYPCDWEKCCEIFEKLYAYTGEATVANSLGYIYYYGRANQGKPDYEKAFKYFSIGAAAGIYESKYKLADMFAHGRAVTRRFDIAQQIYDELYEENYKIFTKGFVDCKYADIALRVGSAYLDSNRCNYFAAYYFYLKADYAIRERMKYCDYYGDLSVFDSIQSAIEKCKMNYQFVIEKHMDLPDLSMIKEMFDDNHSVEFTLKHLKGSKIRITAKRQQKRTEFEALKVLFAFVPFGGCYFSNELTFHAMDVLDYEGEDQFVCDYIEADGNGFHFFNGNKEVACLECRYFRLPNPIKKKENEEYRFVSVKLDGENVVEYLCSDIYTQPGDSVYVPTENGIQKGQVVKAYIRDMKMMPLPLEAYQQIIRKTQD